MDLTLIRHKDGTIIGAALGHIAAQPPRQPAPGDQAGPMAVAGQTFVHVTVSDEEFAKLQRGPHSFGQGLKEHFKEHFRSNNEESIQDPPSPKS
jgi:hypothetical protein